MANEVSSQALLIPLQQNLSNVPVGKNEFVIGRAVNASYDIKNVAISRTHCIISFNGKWLICDKSSSGTWLNKERLKPNENTSLKDGDLLTLGASQEFIFVFCTGGDDCPKSCSSRKCSLGAGVHAELAQRRRVFEYKASLQKDDMQESILKNQIDRQCLEKLRKELLQNLTTDLTNLEERLQQQQKVLEESSNVSETKLAQERKRLEEEFGVEKEKLTEIHDKHRAELESKIQSYQEAENEFRRRNQELSERLDNERAQFEKRLEEERKVLEAKLAEQLAEQQKLTIEKVELEEALRNRIQNLEETAHLNDEQKQSIQAEREKEKTELEKRLHELSSKLQVKEKQEMERESELKERDRELQVQEEQRECDRKKRETEFLAREEELRELKKEMELELRKREQLEEKEAELRHQAAEREAERVREQARLQEEIKLREQEVRQQLESEIAKLQEEKIDIEQSIRGELNKKEGENAENLNKLKAELESVKKDLATTSTKRTLLEKELVEAASESGLKAKKEIIDNFGNLFETELQCSICSELFVQATSLNCNHTFCHECISNWLAKSKRRDCPMCRESVVQQSRSLALDNFIDRMVENLSEELKARRKAIVEERKGSASTAKKRKVDGQQGQAAPRPLQVLNGNTFRGPVQPGTLIRVTAPASIAAVPSGSGYRLVSVASTSQAVAMGGQQQAGPRPPSQPQRHQLLPMQLQHLVPQSSSAPNQMIRIANPAGGQTTVSLLDIQQHIATVIQRPVQAPRAPTPPLPRPAVQAPRTYAPQLRPAQPPAPQRPQQAPRPTYAPRAHAPRAHAPQRPAQAPRAPTPQRPAQAQRPPTPQRPAQAPRRS